MAGIQLDGKVALVTGASRGIGAVVACRLAQAGAKVGVNYHASPDSAEIVVESINKGGGEAILVGGDVSQEENAEKVVKDLVDHYGSIDILINNAGINKDQLLIRMKPEDFDSVINVNLRGAFLCTRYAMAHMIRQRSGRVINMSSVVGLSGNPGQANYAAAKAGLVGLTKAVAREVASRNVTVNALAPGYIDTAMVDELTAETQDKILSTIPMGRFGRPEDVAEAVVFLASDGASYITGQVLTIDGGMIA
jgi:3-oxoacyl-[acyl-carrier protein] reductase